MAGLVPAIHVFPTEALVSKAWMAATSAAMTNQKWLASAQTDAWNSSTQPPKILYGGARPSQNTPRTNPHTGIGFD
jgi:hypothetical protein